MNERAKRQLARLERSLGPERVAAIKRNALKPEVQAAMARALPSDFAELEAMREVPEHRWPHSSEVQSLVFQRSRAGVSFGDTFTMERAKHWAHEHGFKRDEWGDADLNPKYIRLRQADPSLFSDLRTITLTDGVQAVVGPRK